MTLALGPDFEVLDARFNQLAFANVHVEKLYTGCRWAEGPAWFPAGRYLVWSDIPNDRMLRWDETDGSVSIFRQPASNSNGNTVDLQGRMVSCEHLSRSVSRTEHDGSRTVLAAQVDGRRFNWFCRYKGFTLCQAILSPGESRQRFTLRRSNFMVGLRQMIGGR